MPLAGTGWHWKGTKQGREPRGRGQLPHTLGALPLCSLCQGPREHPARPGEPGGEGGHSPAGGGKRACQQLPCTLNSGERIGLFVSLTGRVNTLRTDSELISDTCLET